MEAVGDILGVVNLVVTAPVVIFVAWELRLAARERPYLKVLRERSFVQVVLAGIVVVFALVFTNNDAPIPPFDTQTTRVITRTMILLAIVPSLYWLRLYRSR